MEIVKFNKPKQSKKKKGTILIEEIISNRPKQGRPSKPKKKNANRKNSYMGVRNLGSHLEAGILYPDIYGPIRVPLPGDVSKTTLGMDRTHLDLAYSAANACQLVIGSAPTGVFYSGTCVQAYTATNASGNFAGGGSANPGVQFPVSSSVSDARLVGLCLTLYYTGSPLNVKGEIILGSIPHTGLAGLVTTTFNNMYYLPGVVKMPLADLINKPARTSGAHYSPDSWGFNPITTSVVDIEIPFFATNNMASDGVVAYELTRTWEVKTQITSGNQLPYESSANGRAVDDAAFTNVMDRISHIPSLVSQGIPDLLTPLVQGISDQLPFLVQSSTRAAMNYATNAMINSVTRSGGRNGQGLLTFG